MNRRTSRRTVLRLELLEARDLLAAAFQTLPELPLFDADTLAFTRAVAAYGQSLGRRSDAFIKVGDSITADPGYLTALGDPGYSPASLAAVRPDLVDTLNTFRTPVDATGANSFNRASTAATPGWTLANALEHAGPEADATNAGIALILIGTNDVARLTGPDAVADEMRALIQSLTARGVVPVVCTLPDQNGAFAGNEPVAQQYSQVIANVAGEQHVPLWNLNALVTGLPNNGLGDGIHLTTSPNGGGAFGPADLLYGQNARNLQALDVLKELQDQVFGDSGGLVIGGWQPLTAGEPVFADAPEPGEGGVVTVRDAASGAAINTLLAFGTEFGGGARAAVADVTGDGVPDVVTVPGDGGGPVVRVFDGRTGAIAGTFLAFGRDFRGGLTVAAGDVDRDGVADIVVGAGTGGGPWVRVFRGGDYAQIAEFLAGSADDRGGVSVAVGTFAGLGVRVVTVAGGANGTVSLFNPGTGAADVSFPEGTGFSGGETVAVADVDRDGAADIVTAPKPGGGPVTAVFNPTTGARTASLMGDPDARRGLKLAVASGAVSEKLLVGTTPGVFVPVG